MAPQRKYSKLSAARVLLIGGTAGVGFAAAEACLEAGATVIVSGSNDERLASAVEKLKEAYPEAASSSGRILGKTCDLSDASKIEANLKALLEFASEGGKIDHIVFSVRAMLSLLSVSLLPYISLFLANLSSAPSSFP